MFEHRDIDNLDDVLVHAIGIAIADDIGDAESADIGGEKRRAGRRRLQELGGRRQRQSVRELAGRDVQNKRSGEVARRKVGVNKSQEKTKQRTKA